MNCKSGLVLSILKISFANLFNLPINKIGLNRKFITGYGSYEDLREESNMSKNRILRLINE